MIETAALAVVKGNPPKFLCAERIAGRARGLYTFPGGSINDAETARSCAVRETNEEVGLMVPETEVQQAFEPLYISQNGIELALNLYWCRYKSEYGVPSRKEKTKHGPWRWVGYEQVCGLVIEGLLTPTVLWGMWPDQALNYVPKLDEFTKQTLKEIMWFTMNLDSVPAQALIPRGVQRVLATI